MTQQWKPNGSNAEYWRSDNPLIAAWWRFGDAPPKNNYLTEGEQGPTNYLSGMLTDSGPQKHHLIPFLVDEIDEDILVPVTGIAPWALSGSGMKVNSAVGVDNNTIYADPAFTIENNGSVTHGSLSPNGVSMYSGMTIIGWAQFPSDDPSINTERIIVGRTDSDTASNSINFRVSWQDLPAATGRYKLRATLKTAGTLTSPGGTDVPTISILHTLDPSFDPTRPANPNFPTDRTKPFWFAAQFRREDVEENRSYGASGSGIIKLWIGTEGSGIIATDQTAYRGSNVGSRYFAGDIGSIPLTVFGDSRGLITGNTTNRHLPSGSILDELIIVNDGFIDPDRILHYALSGMTDVTTSNPESLDFVAEFPGSSGLVAYWSFDDDTGTNSAPPTQGDPRLELSLSGTPARMSFVDGVNGGRALRLTPTRTSVFNSDQKAALNSTEYPLIPAESGLPLLWPSGHVVDEGMTIIGWSRSPPTGTTLLGGAFGWFGANDAQQSFWIDAYNSSSPTTNANVLGVIMQPSGMPDRAPVSPLMRLTSRQSSTAAGDRMASALGLSNSSTRSDPQFDTSDDGWHLWAGVYDVHAGMVYMVKDAKFIIPMSQQISSASGFSSDNFGPGEAFFGFTPRGVRSWEIDNFAVYNRILSIPEMSGFALNGIEGAPIETDVDVSFKSLVGYWPLTGTTNYDPTGVSGYRVDDKSWYSHHLTNLSGQFSFDSARLNSELTTFATSTQVELSGSMISLERLLHGANLDASTTNLFATSGFSAGAWVYLPSGDLSTEGQGTSGLFGSHMIMGAWGEADDDRSWFMGIEGNRLALKFVEDNGGLNEFSSTIEPTYNEAFFVGCNFFPSGATLNAQMVKIASASSSETQYAVDSTFASSSIGVQSVGASGFSLLNAASRQWGFPSGTRIQHAFMNMGFLNEDRWQRVKRDGINIQTLASGSVSVTDPENISHWRFDKPGNRVLDFGKENNALFPINTDGHKVGVEGSIHSSGVVVRKTEYLDTIPSNPGSKRLDLGSGTQSWTMLTWVKPPVISSTDLHVIMNKGSGPAVSPTGIKVYTPSDSLNPQALAASDTVAGQNGDLAPTEWNHLAVTYDRDNDEFGVIVNGRYAGTSFISLGEIEVNNSGLSLGGRGDQQGNALAGGSSFSGLLDDTMLFSRVLTLPEISGLAANSYNFSSNAGTIDSVFGGWMSGINQQVVSGLVGSFMHGVGQDIDLFAGYVSGVSGVVNEYGGFIHGRAFASGLTGGFAHGLASQSGLFGHFIHGQGIVSGLIGSYTYGACQTLDEFDVTLTFEIVTSKDFDARLGVEKTEIYDFDSRLGVIRITQPPVCTLEMPAVGLIASGTPYTLTVEGSGIAQDQKKVSKTRFTFADFKKGEDGTLVDGVPFSGLYRASREFDTPGWYTVKMEVLDSYGYRTSCTRPFLLVPSGSTSGAYLATLPGVSISGTPQTGSAIQRVFFTHSLSGLDTTSGLLEYTDFSDQQESLVNSLEVPSGTQFVDFVRTHDYTMPGRYSPVWAVSGSWGVVSDSLSDGIDYLG